MTTSTKPSGRAHSTFIQRWPILIFGTTPTLGGNQSFRRTRSSAGLRLASMGSCKRGTSRASIINASCAVDELWLRPRIVYSLLPCQPASGQKFECWRQTRAVIGVRRHFNCLCLRRVGMNDPRDRAQADTGGDRERESVDHLPGMARDHGGAQNSIGAISHMYLHESFLFAVSHRAIDVMHQNRESPHRDG